MYPNWGYGSYIYVYKATDYIVPPPFWHPCFVRDIVSGLQCAVLYRFRGYGVLQEAWKNCGFEVFSGHSRAEAVVQRAHRLRSAHSIWQVERAALPLNLGEGLNV